MAEGEEGTMLLSAQNPGVCTSQGLKALAPLRVSPLAVEFSGRAVAEARIHQGLCGQEMHKMELKLETKEWRYVTE